jgi:hypothetical protein
VTDAAGKAGEVFSRHYRDLHWEPVSVDLAPFAGQRIRLKLIADCGPANDTTADHALWAAPGVVLRDDREMQTVIRRGD